MGEGVHYSSVKFKKNLKQEPAVTHDEDVTYSEVKPTNHTSSCTVSHCGSAEKREQSSHPYRLAAVCLGLLCALLLAATLVLCVLYTNQSQKYSMLARGQEELRANNSTLNRDKEQLQRESSAVFKKLPFMEQYCPRDNSQKRVCKPCPQGWEQFSSKCYYFSTEGKSWMNSHRDCVRQGADLVIIESGKEQEFITKYIQDLNWIGLSDSETEGTWLWVDGTLLQKNYWRSGEPDNRFQLQRDTYTPADCALTYPGKNLWVDAGCHLFARFICETDALLL
ncbi:CD209 antigen-like protein C isoform X1 [Conger conger]|uniref:CD209 antigen-like protein C isoform X1 n=1 Tax=Conger conger TaxID=82655 RepID=UPI002A59F998|nr:CD209 antigen-like protein C isoform X1 [Conger conger]